MVVRFRDAPARIRSGESVAGGFIAEAEVRESIAHYVVRTGEGVILNDAATHDAFCADPYLRRPHGNQILPAGARRLVGASDPFCQNQIEAACL